MNSIRDVWVHANRIIRAAKQLTGAGLRQLGLSSVEGSVLLHLYVQGGALSQDQIAGDLDFDKAAVSRAIAEMEARELVRRQRREDDRRAYTLALTDEARALAPRIEAVFDGMYNRVLDDMEVAEVEQVLALLARISDSLAK